VVPSFFDCIAHRPADPWIESATQLGPTAVVKPDRQRPAAERSTVGCSRTRRNDRFQLACRALDLELRVDPSLQHRDRGDRPDAQESSGCCAVSISETAELALANERDLARRAFRPLQRTPSSRAVVKA
jgi:hypothetical protein